MQTLLACLHVDAVFEFTQVGYNTVEATGLALLTVMMAPNSGILGKPVQVMVQTVGTEDAVGEIILFNLLQYLPFCRWNFIG